MERVFICMSGGVDSSVAAALLKERGYDTVGVTLRLKPGDGADGDIEDAKNVAKALKIEHCVLDLRGEFKEKVMDYFAAEYLRGATPNPCVVCNREIKFGAMLKFALENGGDYVATGHYASLDKSGERTKLLRSDSAKDQSYFLCMLSEFQLAHAMFALSVPLQRNFLCRSRRKRTVRRSASSPTTTIHHSSARTDSKTWARAIFSTRRAMSSAGTRV